ncbi:MAG: Uma2 family endonuclease, partial [Snowella sp.]
MYQPKTLRTLPKEQLPTMYDLPSEEIGDSGLPDQYHFWQGELLSETFVPPNYPSNQVFVACDLNLYYTLDHPLWYKRPDWFAVVGVERFYRKNEP